MPLLPHCAARHRQNRDNCLELQRVHHLFRSSFIKRGPLSDRKKLSAIQTTEEIDQFGD